MDGTMTHQSLVQPLAPTQAYEFIPTKMIASGEGMTCAYTIGDELWLQLQLEDGRVVFFKSSENPYATDSK